MSAKLYTMIQEYFSQVSDVIIDQSIKYQSN